jgi:type IV secretion system protein TrbL
VSDVWNPVFAGLMIFSLMGYLAFKSDAIAANLASGSTNMGTADVASAAAMGAAAGAAIATGGASVAAGAAKAGQPMGDFMKSLAGSGGGSVSNASSSGTGPAPTGQAPVPPSMSMGVGGPSAANKPPARPTPVNAGSNALSNPPAATSAPTPSSSGGLEANAGIGAPPSSLEQQVGDLVKTLNQPKLEKGVTEHLSELNQHVAREQASTHVSINTHHSE